MKCICGYEYEVEYNYKPKYEEKIIKGDEPFISIIGKFFREGDTGYYRTPVEIYLYGCPKCKTIRFSE